jgi:hypothetical protein
MRLRWDGDRPLADRAMVAALYEVSERTVRRHCTPVDRDPRAGQPRGAGVAWYDAFAAGDALADVAPRPAQARTLAALTYRRTRRHETGTNHPGGN